MGGKSEERKIAETQTEAEKEMFEEKLAQEKEMFAERLAQELGQLRGIQLGQEEALQRAQKVYGIESDRFRDLQQRNIAELSGTPQEITQLQQLIREKALPEQQQALMQTKLAQTQAGVRGPEAALQAAMASSRMGTDLARATQEVALRQALEDRSLRQKEALRRQQAAETFAQQKAISGLGQTLAPVQKYVGGSALEKKQKKEIEDLQKKLEEQQQKEQQQNQAIKLPAISIG